MLIICFMHIFTVSEFVEYINIIFAEQETVIEGETIDFKTSQGKWVFFDLKDEKAKIGCFLTVFQLRGMLLEDGMKIRVFGYPKIHPKSGRFSIIVRHIELIGEGAFKRAFEIVKAKLDKEGLFAAERKRPLPKFPRSIGLITSKESAAYSDFIKILNSRWGGVKIHLANVAVQGREAVFSIAAAFDYFNKNNAELGIEAIVLIRGGGSLEDLAAFNSEEVARAVFSSKAPVVCGVGHERDFTIADLAADARVSTPTDAAQTIVPSREEIKMIVGNNIKTIDFHLKKLLEDYSGNLSSILERVYSIADIEKDKADILFKSLYSSAIKFQNTIIQVKKDVEQKEHSLFRRMDHLIISFSDKITYKAKILKNLDPKKIMARGYSLVYKGRKLIKTAENIGQKDKINVKLFQGEFEAEVLTIQD